MAAEYMTNVSAAREALTRLAALLPDDDTTISEFHVELLIQVVSHRNSDPEPTRMDAVRRLATAFGVPVETRTDGTLWGTPPEGTYVHGVDVTVFTGISSPEEVRLRQENAALRARLEAVEG